LDDNLPAADVALSKKHLCEINEAFATINIQGALFQRRWMPSSTADRRSTCLSRFVNRCAGFLQSVFPGKLHTRKLLVTVMKLLGVFWMFNQRVITSPIPVRQLMKFHFDFDAFVDGLNHNAAISFRGPFKVSRVGWQK
jgi:hypothetical protein